jgi:hypothetical protein
VKVLRQASIECPQESPRVLDTANFGLAVVFEDDHRIQGDGVVQKELLYFGPAIPATPEIHPHSEALWIKPQPEPSWHYKLDH